MINLKEGLDYPSITPKIETSCGVLFLTIVFNKEETQIMGVLPSFGKAGGCASAHLRTLATQLNALFKAGVTNSKRVDALMSLSGAKCHQPTNCIDEVVQHLIREEMRLIDESYKKGGGR